MLVAQRREQIRLARGRTAALIALVCLTLPGVAHADAPLPATACIEVGLTPSPLDRRVADAVRVLEQAGHDPQAYDLELRLEDLHHPDFRDIEAQLVPSVVFVPRDALAGYPLRVHPRNPCNVGWLWRPEAFTPWQRKVVEQARLALTEVAPRSEMLLRADVELLESADELTLSIFTIDDRAPAPSRERIRLTIRKSDLTIRELRDASPTGSRGKEGARP